MRVVGSHTIQLHESSAHGASTDMGSAPVRRDVWDRDSDDVIIDG